MRLRILFVGIMLSCVGCDDNGGLSKTCSVSDIQIVKLIDDLKSSLTNCGCDISIIQGRYGGQTVFFTAINDPACDSINTPTLYGCDGEVVRVFTTSERDQRDLAERVTWEQVIYTCSK